MPRNKSSQRRKKREITDASGRVVAKRKELDATRFTFPNTGISGKNRPRVKRDPRTFSGTTVRVRPGEPFERALRRFKKKSAKEH